MKTTSSYLACPTDILTPSCHVELKQYAKETAVAVRSSNPLLLVCYLKTYTRELEHWLQDWKIADGLSVDTGTCIQKARPISLSDIQQCVSKQHGISRLHLIHNLLTCTAQVSKVRKKAAKRFGVLGPSLIQKRPVRQKR
jgi:hypothetical protein